MTDDGGTGSPIKRLLLAYDGREPARRALEMAVELARATRAHVGIVSVVPRTLGVVPDDPWGPRSEHASELYEARRAFEQEGLEVETHEPAGEAGPAIVRMVRDFGYDTVVVGSRHMDPLLERVLGSVSSFVIHHANANVLVVR